MRYPASASTLAAFALLLLPAALAAQATATPAAGTRPVGCRGTNTESSAISAPGGPGGQPIVIPSYPTVVDVGKGSPAEAAGMRVGDMVLMQDGRDLVANPPTEPRAPGDTVQLVVMRDGAEVTLTVRLGRWDPEVQVGDTPRVCRPV